MLKFNSQADEIRHYTKELLQDGNSYSVKEIKNYIKQKIGKHFTDGAYAGALRSLVKNDPDYIVPERGMYKFSVKHQRNNLAKDAIFIIQGNIKRIFGLVANRNPLEITEEDQKVVDILKETVSYLEKATKKLEEEQKNDNK